MTNDCSRSVSRCQSTLKDAYAWDKYAIELCRRTLQRADSRFRRGIQLDCKLLHVLVVCGHGCKCVREMKLARPYDRQLLAASHSEVRTPLPHLVHFAYDTLTQVKITARHGRVWIRSTESAHSSLLEVASKHLHNCPPGEVSPG